MAALLAMLVVVLAGLGQPVAGLTEYSAGPLVSTTSGSDALCVLQGEDPLPGHCCSYEVEAARAVTSPSTGTPPVMTGLLVAVPDERRPMLQVTSHGGESPRKLLQVWRC